MLLLKCYFQFEEISLFTTLDLLNDVKTKMRDSATTVARLMSSKVRMCYTSFSSVEHYKS